ncbi:alkaline phosphatase [Patulibacter sp. S7RM1-6]
MAFSRTNRGRRPLVAAAAATVVLAGGTATAVAVGTGADHDKSGTLASQIDPSVPKNVIMLVGDGMGESEVSIARSYQGVDRPLNMDRLPFRGVATTYDLTPLDDVASQGRINFDPDSASTATAWSTGHKTMINRLGQGNSANRKVPGENHETTIEAAKKLGKWTGNVTTAEVTDATPAGPTAHISQRSCQGPADTRSTCPSEATGASADALGSIAEQQVALRPDITFGAGRARFEQTLEANGTETVVDAAKAAGFRYITTKDEMDAIGSLGDAPGDAPVLGLFHDKEVDNNAANMVTEWKGPTAKLASADGNPAECVKTHRADTAPQEPALSAMAQKSIDLLDAASAAHGDNGFFLQIEGASIDKRDHAANPCEQIGETLEFDKAIGIALDYQQQHPDTLVVVSADHSHSSQIVSATGDTPTGYYNTITTPSGDKLRIAYGTNGGNTSTHTPATEAPSQQHTGAAVPVMAVGPQAANVTGTIDQTDLFPLLTFRKVASELPGGGTTTVPGPTTTVTGPTTTVPVPVPAPEGKLTAGLATPGRVSNAAARKGFSLSLLASKAGKARVTVTSGRTTVARGTVAVKANRATAVRVKATKLRAGRSGRLRVTATVTAGKERVTRHAGVRVTKR